MTNDNVIKIKKSSTNRSVCTADSDQLLHDILPKGPCALKNEYTLSQQRVIARLNQTGKEYDSSLYPVDQEIQKLIKRCPDREKVKNLTIEYIKSSLLRKLRLEKPPDVKKRLLPDIPKLNELKTKVNLDQNFINIAAKQSFIIFGNSPGDSTITFILRKDYKFDLMKHAWLNVFLKPQSMTAGERRKSEYTWIFVSYNDTFVARKKINLTATSPPQTNRWHKIDITQSIQTFFQSKVDLAVIDSNYTIKIKCGVLNDNTDLAIVRPFNDTEINLTPYLFVRLHRLNVSRSKRELTSTSKICAHDSYRTSQCCRYILEINFHEIGWYWVIAPVVYKTYYCAGDCPDMNIFAYEKRSPDDEWMYSFTRKPEDSSCCSGKKYSDMSMLYQTEDNQVWYEHLPRMILEECGCS